MPDPPKVLEAIGVYKVYPTGSRALDDVTLALREAECLALIGASGSGKTTLLRLFNRTLEASAGQVSAFGQPIETHDPIALRRRIGYVPQNGGLLPHWTAARNVELVPELLGWPAARRRQRRDGLLEMVGLDPAEHGVRYPSELSGGQRQRVAFARALAAEPRLLLLDEPFGALDALTRAELHDDFAGWRRRLDVATLLVTHDLDEAFRLADRIAVLKDGVVLRCATPSELAEEPRHDYVARLLGRATAGRSDR